ncbi:MAG: sensor histidine kinase, partial [Gemmataceae bacterium]
ANELNLGFIKVASHELRTPLTIVLGLSELARQTPALAEPLKGWLEQIYQGSVRLSRLIDQIVQMLVAGRFDRPLARCDVAVEELVRQAVIEVAAFLERRQLTLEVDIRPDVGTFSVEADKIRDSLTHLLLNAIKFTPDGGTVHVSGRRLPTGCIELEVRDSGMGIDPSKVEHVFEPFFTDFDVSRHSSGVFEFGRRGLGLGLALVKAFVELHGGTIRVDSIPGQGSTFTMTFPAAAPQEPQSSR